MGLDSGFVELTTQLLTVDPLSTHSSYGAATYTTAQTSSYPAYVEPGNRLVLTDEGVEQMATGTVYVLTTSGSVSVQDRVTLPDGRQPRLLAVDVVNDEKGQHHLEVAIR